MATFPANIAPADALAFMRDKVELPTETWADIWQGAHARAFVVAGATSENLVKDLHEAVSLAIEKGMTLEQFRANFDQIVETHGWKHRGSRGFRARVIFETNTRTAYMAAKWKTFVENKAMRPYLRYVGILDDRIRKLHRAWHDTVLPVAHPWWNTHFPPNGWGCRCDVQSLSERDIERRGFRVQPEAPPSVMVQREVRTSKGSEWVWVPKGIDPGWNYNVGQAAHGPPTIRRVHRFTTLASPLVMPAPPMPAPVPTRTVPLEAAPSTPDELREALRQAIGGASAVFTDPLRAMIEVGLDVAEHLLEKDKADWKRALYFPFIREAIEQPQEIWVGFGHNDDTRRVELRRRYVRYVEVRGGKLVGIVTEMVGRRLVGVTFIAGQPKPNNMLRSGLLIYQAQP